MPRRPKEAGLRRSSALRPRPSSAMRNSQPPPGVRDSRICTRRASACLATLFIASCATRYRHSATASRGSPSFMQAASLWTSTWIDRLCACSAASSSSAASRPSSSSSCGIRSLTMRRQLVMAALASSSRRNASAGSRDGSAAMSGRMAPISSLIAASTCCSSSCSARAMRRRSSSCTLVCAAIRRSRSRCETFSSSAMRCCSVTSRRITVNRCWPSARACEMAASSGNS